MKKYQVCDCILDKEVIRLLGVRRAIEYYNEDLVVVNGILHDKNCCEHIAECDICGEWVDKDDLEYSVKHDLNYCPDCEDYVDDIGLSFEDIYGAHTPEV